MDGEAGLPEQAGNSVHSEKSRLVSSKVCVSSKHLSGEGVFKTATVKGHKGHHISEATFPHLTGALPDLRLHETITALSCGQ